MQQICSLQQWHLPPLTQFSKVGALSPMELRLNLLNKFILKHGGDGAEATDAFA
jgi:hypothetical protein